MLLVIAYTESARQALRNLSRAHEDHVAGRFGRAVLLEPTEFAALQAVRLRAELGPAVQVEHTRPFNEFETLREDVREAAMAYADRENAATPYAKFAAGTVHPDQSTLAGREL